MILELFHPRKPVRLYGLEAIACERFETWVRMPERTVIFGRTHGGRTPYVESDDDSTGRSHCELQPGGLLVDLTSTGGTCLEDDDKLDAPHQLRDGEAFHVGAPGIGTLVRLHVDVELGAADEIERGLLAAVAERVPGGDDVYLDWLEQQGHTDRAELWRLVRTLAEAPHHIRADDPRLVRHRELSRRIDWRHRMRGAVARPPWG